MLPAKGELEQLPVVSRQRLEELIQRKLKRIKALRQDIEWERFELRALVEQRRNFGLAEIDISWEEFVDEKVRSQNPDLADALLRCSGVQFELGRVKVLPKDNMDLNLIGSLRVLVEGILEEETGLSYALHIGTKDVKRDSKSRNSAKEA